MMRTATGLTLLAIGAILAFAVTTNTSVFNLNVAGYILMLVAIAGLVIPRKRYTSLSRRFVRRRTRVLPNGQVVETEDTAVPPYLTQNPGSPALDDLPTGPSLTPDPTVRAVMTPGERERDEVIEELRDD
jgi:hypothetical protein